MRIFKAWIVIACAVWIVLGILFIYKGFCIQTWPVVKGEIINSRIVEMHDRKRYYELDITYTYQIGEEIYESNSFRPGKTISSKWTKPLRDVLEMFPVKKQVIVYYNPGDHSEAYLMTGLDFRGVGLVVFPLIILLLVLLFSLWRRIIVAAQKNIT